MFSGRAAQELASLTEKYPEKRSALLPALNLAQRELGWLSQDALKAVAEALDIPPSIVKGVATFHVLFKRAPSGRHMIQLCTNVSCMLFGADTLLELLRKKYGLAPGGTSEDGRFTLLVMECIGACDEAPAMLVDADLHGNLTEQRIIEILERYE